MKKKWKIIIGVVVVLGMIGWCSEQNEGSSTQEEKEKTEQTTVEEKKSAWDYSETTDEMTDAVTYFAVNESTNEVDFDFPYNGGSKLSVNIRNKGKKNEIIFSISKGQFNAGIDGQALTIRIDEGSAFKVNCSVSNDGSSDILFVNNPSKLLASIKSAKTMKVQAEFFQEGLKTFDFNVEGLEWNH